MNYSMVFDKVMNDLLLPLGFKKVGHNYYHFNSQVLKSFSFEMKSGGRDFEMEISANCLCDGIFCIDKPKHFEYDSTITSMYIWKCNPDNMCYDSRYNSCKYSYEELEKRIQKNYQSLEDGIINDLMKVETVEDLYKYNISTIRKTLYRNAFVPSIPLYFETLQLGLIKESNEILNMITEEWKYGYIHKQELEKLKYLDFLSPTKVLSGEILSLSQKELGQYLDSRIAISKAQCQKVFKDK